VFSYYLEDRLSLKAFHANRYFFFLRGSGAVSAAFKGWAQKIQKETVKEGLEKI